MAAMHQPQPLCGEGCEDTLPSIERQLGVAWKSSIATSTLVILALAGPAAASCVVLGHLAALPPWSSPTPGGRSLVTAKVWR